MPATRASERRKQQQMWEGDEHDEHDDDDDHSHRRSSRPPEKPISTPASAGIIPPNNVTRKAINRVQDAWGISNISEILPEHVIPDHWTERPAKALAKLSRLTGKENRGWAVAELRKRAEEGDEDETGAPAASNKTGRNAIGSLTINSTIEAAYAQSKVTASAAARKAGEGRRRGRRRGSSTSSSASRPASITPAPASITPAPATQVLVHNHHDDHHDDNDNAHHQDNLQDRFHNLDPALAQYNTRRSVELGESPSMQHHHQRQQQPLLPSDREAESEADRAAQASAASSLIGLTQQAQFQAAPHITVHQRRQLTAQLFNTAIAEPTTAYLSESRRIPRTNMSLFNTTTPGSSTPSCGPSQQSTPSTPPTTYRTTKRKLDDLRAEKRKAEDRFAKQEVALKTQMNLDLLSVQASIKSKSNSLITLSKEAEHKKMTAAAAHEPTSVLGEAETRYRGLKAGVVVLKNLRESPSAMLKEALTAEADDACKMLMGPRPVADEGTSGRSRADADVERAYKLLLGDWVAPRGAADPTSPSPSQSQSLRRPHTSSNGGGQEDGDEDEPSGSRDSATITTMPTMHEAPLLVPAILYELFLRSLDHMLLASHRDVEIAKAETLRLDREAANAAKEAEQAREGLESLKNEERELEEGLV